VDRDVAEGSLAEWWLVNGGWWLVFQQPDTRNQQPVTTSLSVFSCECWSENQPRISRFIKSRLKRADSTAGHSFPREMSR
jgi:hypothetical protein